jgi:hypothetical protein
MQPKLLFHRPGRTRSPPLPYGVVGQGHGVWRRPPGGSSRFKRDCVVARLLAAVSAPNASDLAAFKGHL